MLFVELRTLAWLLAWGTGSRDGVFWRSSGVLSHLLLFAIQDFLSLQSVFGVAPCNSIKPVGMAINLAAFPLAFP
jgi:hypothetical protein